MNFVLEELEKRKAISLSLWTKPHHSQGIYHKFGFKIIEDQRVNALNATIFKKKLA
jgi:hypothetical protein